MLIQVDNNMSLSEKEALLEPKSKRCRVDDDTAMLLQLRSDLSTLRAESRQLNETMQKEKRTYQNESLQLEQLLEDLKRDHEEIFSDLAFKKSQNSLQIQQLSFQELCLSLRKNDATVAQIKSNTFYPRGYAKPLGEALAGNEIVTSIDLDLAKLLPYVNDDFVAQPNVFVEPLIRFIRQNPSLRRVTLRNEPGSYDNDTAEAIVASFLWAVAENPSIDDVNLWSLQYTFPEFSRFFSDKCQTLKSFVDDFGLFEGSSPIDQAPFVASFKRAKALERLALSGLQLSGSFVVFLLKSVTIGCPLLQELELSTSLRTTSTTSQFWIALAKLFHSTTMLRHIKFGALSFRASDMKGLIKCLKRPDQSGPSSTTVSKLSFHECNFNKNATDALVGFMQTRNACSDGHGSSLRELCGFGGKEIVDMLAAVPNAAEYLAGSKVTTIGSQLRTVSLPNLNRVDMNKFGALSKFIQWPILRLGALENSTDCLMLERLITLFPSIREVHIARVRSEIPNLAETLVRMVQKNGHLCQFTVARRARRLFNAAQQRRIDLYCQRNRFLIELIEKRHWGYYYNEETPNAELNVAVENLYYPLLLQTATRLHVDRMRKVLSGLDYSFGCTEGPI